MSTVKGYHDKCGGYHEYRGSNNIRGLISEDCDTSAPKANGSTCYRY